MTKMGQSRTKNAADNRRDKRHLAREAMKNRQLPAHKLAENCGLEVSTTSICNYLHDANIYSRVAAKKPFVSAENQKKRLSWCKERSKWHVFPEWSGIIWSDESSVEIGKSSRRELIWRKPGERYNLDCLRPTFKSGRKSVMIWGCFVGNRLGPLVFCDGSINSDAYIEILEQNLIGFKASVEEEQDVPLILQEDNAAVHVSKKSKKWKEENGIVCLPWPAQSPDLNPIEKLWKILKDNVQKMKSFPRTIKALKIALEEEWGKLDPNLLSKLVESMPKRVKLVVDAKGGPTKY
jgi:transposase